MTLDGIASTFSLDDVVSDYHLFVYFSIGRQEVTFKILIKHFSFVNSSYYSWFLGEYTSDIWCVICYSKEDLILHIWYFELLRRKEFGSSPGEVAKFFKTQGCARIGAELTQNMILDFLENKNRSGNQKISSIGNFRTYMPGWDRILEPIFGDLARILGRWDFRVWK